MKAITITVLSVTLAVAGAKELRSHIGNGTGSCWSPDKIKAERFSTRGLPGSIRSFQINSGDGCVFNVKVELDTPARIRLLDYEARYVAGDRPVFIRYNKPP